MALISSGSAGATQPSPTSQKGDPMGLKEYDVEVNGYQTTLQLSDEDAKAMGLTKKDLASVRIEAAAAAEAEAAAKEAAEKEAAELEAKQKAEAEAAAAAEAEKAKAAAAPANKAAKPPANKSSDAG